MNGQVVTAAWPQSGKAKIAFVGDAPAHGEHIPLTGSAGAVFNAMLRTANLDRDEYLITNVYDEPADEEELDGFVHDEERTVQAFLRLNEELREADVNVIVPLGGIALWAFTGQKMISNFRGAVTAATNILPGAKLVPTFHPSAVQKSWKLLSIVVGDFVKAADEAERGKEITYPKVELLIEPSIADIKRFKEECDVSPKLSVDIETGWGQITSIAFAPTETRAMAIPFVDLRKPNKSYWRHAEEEFQAWRLVQAICENPQPKVGQNAMYDVVWLYVKHGVALRNYRFDTRLRHKVQWPELPADLANMSATYTRVGSYKNWGGRYQKATEKKDG